MKKLIYLLCLLLIQFTANAQETFTQQWLTVLDSSTSNTDQLTAGIDQNQVITGGCSVDFELINTPRLALSYSGNHVACIGMSDCNIMTSELNTINGSSAFQDIYTGASPENGFGVTYDKNNNLFSLGVLNVSNNSSSSVSSNFLRKYDSTGTIQFTNIIHNYNSDEANEMRLDDSGRIMLANVSYNGSQNVHPLYCYNNSGTLQWSSIIDVNYDYYYGYMGELEVDDSDNTVFTGKYQPTEDPAGYEVVIRKVNSAGTQLWQVNYSSYPECFADNIAIDKNGDIYMLINTNAFSDERLVKFSGVSGDVIWDVANTYGTRETDNIKINIDSNVIVMSNSGQSIYYINHNTGNTIWSKAITNGRSLGTDAKGNVYEVSTDMLRIYSSTGSLLDSIIVSIPGYTTILNSIVINQAGNIFYLLGERSTSSTNKIFVTKFYSNSSSISCNDSSVDITTGLVGWYPFTGNANDSSGNGNNGTVFGATLTTDRFGDPNSAYLFNGSSDYIHVNLDTPLNTTTISGLSMSLWCKLNSITTIAGLLCLYDSTNSNLYGFEYDQVNRKFSGGYGVNGQDGEDIYDTIRPDTNSWYNLIYTCNYSSNICKLYVNGIFQNQSDSTLIRPVLGGLNIGRWFPGGNGWYTNGKISDVRIYNRVLTSCDADSLYNLTSTSNTTGIVNVKNDNFKMQTFPNPTSGLFDLQVTAQQNEKAELIITDIVGRVVSDEMIEINQGVNNKEITQPISGTYFITIKTDSGQQTDKLIVIQ